MQVKATYEDGAIHFSQTLRFKHRKFDVVVTVPESEIISTETPAEAVNSEPASLFLAKIQQILGPYYYPRPAVSVEQDKADYLEALTEKHGQ
jgi:hypothetical protein